MNSKFVWRVATARGRADKVNRHSLSLGYRIGIREIRYGNVNARNLSKNNNKRKLLPPSPPRHTRSRGSSQGRHGRTEAAEGGGKNNNKEEIGTNMSGRKSLTQSAPPPPPPKPNKAPLSNGTANGNGLSYNNNNNNNTYSSSSSNNSNKIVAVTTTQAEQHQKFLAAERNDCRQAKPQNSQAAPISQSPPRTEQVVMTPRGKTANSTVILIERKLVDEINDRVHVAGGDHTGIIINKDTIAGQKSASKAAALSLEFRVFLVSANTGKHSQESRTLRFWFRDWLTNDEKQAHIAQDFFKELVSPQDFPRGNKHKQKITKNRLYMLGIPSISLDLRVY